MTLPMLRGALIGCGFFAVNHLHGWRDCNGAEIIAICDQNAERLHIVGEQFGIAKRYASVDEMLKVEELDFVDIATTAASHRMLVEKAAKNGLGVICQKPFATTIADAKAMVQICAAANVPLMVHENFRWQSPIQTVQKILASGEIGKAFWARVSFRSAYDVFSGQPYLATGERFIVEDLGIHALDVARFLMGNAKSISARMMRINPSIKGEDVATMMLDHADGVTSIVDCSYASIQQEELFPQTLLEIDGHLGSLKLSANYQLSITTKAGTRHLDVSPPLLPWASKPWHNIQESVALIQQHWVDSWILKRAPQTSGLDNLQTLGLVEAAYQSAATGQTVELSKVLA